MLKQFFIFSFLITTQFQATLANDSQNAQDASKRLVDNFYTPQIIQLDIARITSQLKVLKEKINIVIQSGIISLLTKNDISELKKYKNMTGSEFNVLMNQIIMQLRAQCEGYLVINKSHADKIINIIVEAIENGNLNHLNIELFKAYIEDLKLHQYAIQLMQERFANLLETNLAHNKQALVLNFLYFLIA